MDEGATPSAAVAATRQGLAAAVHANCGQLCGQPVVSAPKAASRLKAVGPAQKISTDFFNWIKHLRRNDKRMTAAIARKRCNGAAVEFSTRASRGFARG